MKYLTHQPINNVKLAVKCARLLEAPVTEILPNEVWDGVTPQIILDIAIHSLDNHELLELEKIIRAYRKNKIDGTATLKSIKLFV